MHKSTEDDPSDSLRFLVYVKVIYSYYQRYIHKFQLSIFALIRLIHTG